MSFTFGIGFHAIFFDLTGSNLTFAFMIKEIPYKRLVIAAYRLPFSFIKTKKSYRVVQNSGGLVSAMLSLSEKFKESNDNSMKDQIIWTGTADNTADSIFKKKFEKDSFSIVPVKIPKHLNDLYYNGFCNDMLWPLFHYFPTYSVFNESYFHAYHEANSIFCSEIVKIIKPGDFIWIHDYQLFLLPAMIRKKVPDVTLGFFLHIPFPSFEIFRLMPRLWRETIINGMLGADLIGFHTHDYNQNFIKTVKRTTGYECRQNIIYTTDRIVKSDAFPIGIDYEKFNSACLKDAVLKEKKRIKSNLAGQKLIFSVDRLDYSKGLLPKLKGYETFLEKYPKWHSKVVFNMVVVPSRDIIEKYKDIKKEIESFIGRINGKFSTLSWRPIIYQYKSLSFNELVALYDMSDIGLITPLRDGMNLVAKEFIACQTENKGVLILSEMAGAAAELNEAILINPADNNEIASSINAALKMKPLEKNARLERMQDRIKNYNVFAWADDFFRQTNVITDQQKKMSVKFINSKIITQIIANYGKARKRILFLDYDGTLVSFSRYPEQANIDKKTLQIVKNLTEDPKNKIVIISGRGKDFLERQFGGLKVTLVAEHGLFLKEINKSWKATIKTDQKWKESVVPILMEYVNRCNGTFIEEKTGSIAWHYRNADSDFAQFRLNELRDDLSEIIRHKTDFEILEGNKVLEVKSGKYDKGEMAKSIMKNKNFDFVLAAGDDKTDESIYRALDEKAYTIRVGLNPSEARFNITDYSLLLRLLQDLKN